MIIDLVIGDRCNFPTASSILRASEQYDAHFRLVLAKGSEKLIDDRLFEVIEISGGKTRMSKRAKNLNFEMWFKANRPDYLMLIGTSDAVDAAKSAARIFGISIVSVDGDE